MNEIGWMRVSCFGFFTQKIEILFGSQVRGGVNL